MESTSFEGEVKSWEKEVFLWKKQIKKDSTYSSKEIAKKIVSIDEKNKNKSSTSLQGRMISNPGSSSDCLKDLTKILQKVYLSSFVQESKEFFSLKNLINQGRRIVFSKTAQELVSYKEGTLIVDLNQAHMLSSQEIWRALEEWLDQDMSWTTIAFFPGFQLSREELFLVKGGYKNYLSSIVSNGETKEKEVLKKIYPLYIREQVINDPKKLQLMISLNFDELVLLFSATSALRFKNFSAFTQILKNITELEKHFYIGGNQELYLLELAIVHDESGEYVKALLDAGADPNHKQSKVPPIVKAILKNRWPTVRLLIDRGALLFEPYDKGKSPYIDLVLHFDPKAQEIVDYIQKKMEGKEEVIEEQAYFRVKTLGHLWSVSKLSTIDFKIKKSLKQKNSSTLIDCKKKQVSSRRLRRRLDHPKVFSKRIKPLQQLLEFSRRKIDSKGLENSSYWCRLLLSTIPKISKEGINKANIQTLMNTLEFADQHTLDSKALLERIQRGEPTLLFSGYDTHQIVFLIWSDLFLICNQGALREIESISSYLIEPSKITVEQISESQKPSNSKERYENLISTLKKEWVKESSDISFIINKSCPLPPQTIGNCTWASLETALYGLFAISNFKMKNTGKGNGFLERDLAKSINDSTTQAHTLIFRVQAAVLEQLIPPKNSNNTVILDHQMIRQAFRQMWTLSKLYPNALKVIEKTEKKYKAYLNRFHLQLFKMDKIAYSVKVSPTKRQLHHFKKTFCFDEVDKK